jgi:hypothetical protein
MKTWLAAVLAAGLCIGCAGGTPGTDNGSSVTMYGTIDQGISFRK